MFQHLGKSSWSQEAHGFQVNPKLLVPLIAFLCAAIFLTDYFQPNIVALAALYAIPVLMSLWLGRKRVTVATALICCLLALIDLEHEQPYAEGNPWFVVANRATTLFTIGVVTSLGLWRQKIERKLYDTREAVTTTLRSIADAVITTDTTGKINFMNSVAEKLTGFPQEEALGRPLESVFQIAAPPRATPPIVELACCEEARSAEAILVDRTGACTPIAHQRAPILDVQGTRYGTVLVFRDITCQKAHEDSMRRLAYRDDLTGLPNRISLVDRISLELAHARRDREMLAVCYLDLDRFKHINDSFGHHVGDAFLKAIAGRLRSALRSADTVARLGGDEFVFLLPGIASPKDAALVANKLLAAVSAPLRVEGHELASGASIGIALFPGDGDEPDTLLRRADKAMYRAKHKGGARVEFSRSPQRSPTTARTQRTPRGLLP